jgi:hypothetical protein
MFFLFFDPLPLRVEKVFFATTFQVASTDGFHWRQLRRPPTALRNRGSDCVPPQTRGAALPPSGVAEISDWEFEIGELNAATRQGTSLFST